MRSLIFIIIFTALVFVGYFILFKEESNHVLNSSEYKNNYKNIVQVEKTKYVTRKEYLSVEKLKKENKYNYTVYDLNDCSDYIYKNYDIGQLTKFYNTNTDNKLVYCRNKLISNDYNLFYNFNNILLINTETKIKEEKETLWNKKSLEYNINFHNKSKTEITDKDTNVVLLIRSYKRPEYLKQCLDSLKEVDLDFFYQKIILDDNSQDDKLIPLYDEFIRLGFKIKVNLENEKQNSFVSCLGLVSVKNKYILYLDNDMIVKKDIHLQLLDAYCRIKTELSLEDNKILLSAFDCNESRHKIIKNYKDYNEKKTIGGANLFFHISLINKFQKWWLMRKDWGICENLIKEKGRIFTTKKSYAQHIGATGSNSKNLKYDTAKNF